jgi:hypothetical protein
MIGKGSMCYLMVNGVEKWVKQRLEVHVPLTPFFLSSWGFDSLELWVRACDLWLFLATGSC